MDHVPKSYMHIIGHVPANQISNLELMLCAAHIAMYYCYIEFHDNNCGCMDCAR